MSAQTLATASLKRRKKRISAAIGVARNKLPGPFDTDDIEIDDEPGVSVYEDGIWVAAWIWISNREIKS